MATITTSDELRLFNRSRVLSSLRSGGRQSRTRLCQSTGLSASTISQVTADLITDGVIERVQPPQPSGNSASISNRRGRPQVVLRLNPDAATTAVLTLLLNKLEVTLYDYCGDAIYSAEESVTTASMSLSVLKKRLFGLLDSALLASGCPLDKLQHITLVCQGTVTRDNSGLIWSPITPLTNVDFRGMLEDRYRAEVTVANDCKMMARAIYYERRDHGRTDCARQEHEQQDDVKQHEAGQTSVLQTAGEKNQRPADDDFAVLLSSYGIGLAYFHHGDILTGSQSSGTEFGHMLFQSGGALCRCGRRGCIEAYASEYAIWRRASGLAADTLPTDDVPKEAFKEMVQQARLKPGLARDAFEEAGAAIGQGLSNLFAIFDPFPAILVGIDGDAFGLMEKSMRTHLKHYGNNQEGGSVLIYDQASERNLTRTGACLHSLSYIDENVFGFGGSAKVQETAAL